MKPSTLVIVFLVAFLVAEVRCGILDGVLAQLCPTVPCPKGKVCVGAGILRMCDKPAGEGKRCAPEDDKNPDGSYVNAPPCAKGLTCQNDATPTCK